MRRLLAALVVTLLGAGFGSGVAQAQSADAEARLAQAAEVASSESERAADLLSGISSDAEATAEQRVRGAQLAIDHLPLDTGNRVAAELVLATLRANRSQPDAWQLAFRIRDRVVDGLDLRNGEPFLRSLIDLYPDQLRFQYYLADLYRDTGRPAEADAQCVAILRQGPDDVSARRLQAYIRELDGRSEEALELYAQMYEIDGSLEPLLYRVKILIEPLRDYDGAEVALREAFAAVEEAPAGRSRNAVRAKLEFEQTRLLDERARRAQLLEIAARQDRLLAIVLGVWICGLGGGLVLLRRRGLI